MTLTIDDFISHRFRGFDARENTIAGMRAALDFGVKHLEFDIRVAKCGTPMIWHDEHAKDGRGKSRKLCDIIASDYAATGGDFARFATFDALLAAAAAHPVKDAKLLIDIKDAGFEVEITSLVRLHRLQDRVVYVSWIPEALYACHALEPDAPLCLSHWCQKPGPLVRKVHKVYTAKNGAVPNSGRKYIHGERSGWFVDGQITGTLRDMLIKTGGSVCVPVGMVTKDLVAGYHADGIEVSVFSYVDLKKAQAHKDAMNIDLYFVDKKRVFDALSSNNS